MITVVYELPFSGVNGAALEDALQNILAQKYNIPPEDITVAYHRSFRIGIEVANIQDTSNIPSGAVSDLTADLKNILGVNCRHLQTINGPTPE